LWAAKFTALADENIADCETSSLALFLLPLFEYAVYFETAVGTEL